MNRHERRAQAKQGRADPRLQQGLAAFQAGRLDEAQAVMAAVLAKSPREPTALHIAGLIAFQQGDPDKAMAQLGAAVKAKPDYAEAQNNFGRLLLMLDRPAEAADRFKAALRHVRDVAEIHAHLGEALLAERQLGSASSSFQRALVLDPRQVSALAGLGTISTALGRGSDAQRWHAAALALFPGFSPSLRGLGEARLISGDAAGAVSGFEAALKAMPQDLALLGNLAVAWREAGRLDRGLAYQRRILALEPATGEALGHLSQGLFVLGRAGPALLFARRRLATESGEIARKAVRATMLYAPDLDPIAASAMRRRLAPVSVEMPRWRNAPDPARPLRVAYLSSDMRDHPVARSLLPLIAGHDRAAIQTHLYGEVAREDAVTERFKALCPWRSTIGLDDEALARSMRKDGIDIAVFVAGSFDANRLEAAARRCAPVQISLHDGGTSGIAAVDALIADRWLVTRRERDRFSERVFSCRISTCTSRSPTPPIRPCPTAHRSSPPRRTRPSSPARLCRSGGKSWRRCPTRVFGSAIEPRSRMRASRQRSPRRCRRVASCSLPVRLARPRTSLSTARPMSCSTPGPSPARPRASRRCGWGCPW